MIARKLFSVFAVVYVVGLGVWPGLVSDLGIENGDGDFFVFPVILGLGIGLFLTLKRPQNPIGLVLSALAMGISSAGFSSVMTGRAYEAGNVSLAVAASLLNDVGFITFAITSLVLLPLWFPTGSAPTRKWRWVAWVAIGGALVGLGLSIVASEVELALPGSGEPVLVANPWGLISGNLGEFAFLAVVLTIPFALTALILRWKRSSGVERLQLRWVGASALLAVASFLLTFGVFGVPQWLIDAALSLSLATVLVSIAVAVMRYRLYEIDRIISRTLSYAIVVVVLGAVYFGTVTLATMVLPSQNSLAVAGATLVVAAVFNPARKRIQQGIDRRFNRSGYQAQALSDEFAAKLREPLTAQQLVQEWTLTVEEALQPNAHGIWLKQSHPAGSERENR